MRTTRLIGLTLVTSILGASVAIAAQQPCQSIAFVGTLEWTKLYPQRELPRSSASLNGYTHVSVSNGCGNAETKFGVKHLLVGPPVTFLIVSSELGEWCKPPIQIDLHSVLVSATRENGEWVMDATAPLTKDQAGAAIILPDYPQTFLGISTDSVRKPLKLPIYMSDIKGLPKPYVKVMVKREVIQRFGKEFAFISAVYISDLQTALRNESSLRAQNCIPNDQTVQRMRPKSQKQPT
ncbi:MAG: hypothetical protein ACRD22_07960 [Terriglobia bacterium]